MVEIIEQEVKQGMLIAKKNIHSDFHTMLRNRECEKIVPELMKVENSFIEHINQENLEHTYDEIFKHHQAEYLKACEYCLRKFNPKHVLINPRYFADKFKSKES